MATTRTASDVWPRVVSLLIGIWLFISAFVWPHAAAEQADTWLLGILIALVSIAAIYRPQWRFANTMLAIWLFFATLLLSHAEGATVWNNSIAAIVVFIMSLIPGHAVRHAGTGQPIRAS